LASDRLTYLEIVYLSTSSIFVLKGDLEMHLDHHIYGKWLIRVRDQAAAHARATADSSGHRRAVKTIAVMSLALIAFAVIGNGVAHGQTAPVTSGFIKPTSPCVVNGCTFGGRWLTKCSDGVWTIHNAVDVDVKTPSQAASNHQQVWAAADGIIRYAGSYGAGWANAVVLEHNVPGVGLVTTVYGHIELASGLVVGRTVTRGTVLGYISPNVTPSHLHFGVRMGGYAGTLSMRGWLYGCKNPAHTPKFPEKWVDPLQFVANHPGLSTTGEYLVQPSDSPDIFDVVNGVRRRYDSWQSVIDDGKSAWPIAKVSPAVIYGSNGGYGSDVGGLQWAAPFPVLPRRTADGAIFLVQEDAITNSTGIYTARWVKSGDAYLGEGLTWSDYRDVPYDPASAYPDGPDITVAEPRLIVTDGPFVDGSGGDYFTAYYRVRNLSTAGAISSVTVRAIRSDGWWTDFPWSSSFNLGQGQEYAGATARIIPSGTYTFKVIYSYWAYGRNLQYFATLGGNHPLANSLRSFTAP